MFLYFIHLTLLHVLLLRCVRSCGVQGSCKGQSLATRSAENIDSCILFGHEVSEAKYVTWRPSDLQCTAYRKCNRDGSADAVSSSLRCQVCHVQGACQGKQPQHARTVKDEEACLERCRRTRHCNFSTFQSFNKVCKVYLSCKGFQETWLEIYTSMRNCTGTYTTPQPPTTSTSTTTTTTTTISTTTTTSTTTTITTTTSVNVAKNKLFYFDRGSGHGNVTLGKNKIPFKLNPLNILF